MTHSYLSFVYSVYPIFIVGGALATFAVALIYKNNATAAYEIKDESVTKK